MDSIIAENLLLVCSICLDSIADHTQRSVAKLKCGHQFHLDCIGSAFNMKGAMVCPNCREIEVGSWLYANGSAPSLSDFTSDEWTYGDDPNEYFIADSPDGLPWWPFSSLSEVRSSFEQVESPPTPNGELVGNHAIFAEHIAASPLHHSHAHVPPIPGDISNASENVDNLIFNYHRIGQSGQNDIYVFNAVLAANVQFQSWGHHSPPMSANRNHGYGVDHASVPSTLRFTRVDTDAISRFGPSALRFLNGDTSFPRGGSSYVSSHNYSSSLISPIMPAVRRSNVQMGLPPFAPGPPQGGSSIFPHSEGQNLHEENSSHISPFPVMLSDRDSVWGSQRQASGGADPSHRSRDVWPRWL